jgi:hypothetical protein
MEKKATSDPDIRADITKNTIIMASAIQDSGPKLAAATGLYKNNKPDKLSG